MNPLELEIAELKEVIKGYETEYKTASTAEKSELRGLIKTSRETLNRLLDEKKAQSGGKLSMLFIVLFIIFCYSEVVGNGVILGARLRDGIPLLQQNLTLSPPSVPSEHEHARCHRIVMHFPFLPEVSEVILNASNSIWEMVHTRSDGEQFRYYSSEDDIAYLVRRYLESILAALHLPLDFNSKLTIKQIRPDICVLLMGIHLVGVVEVKKPNGKTALNVLHQPTVLGELLDQMMLMEGFYGMGPVIGILTTAEEWLISWFPVDSDALAHVDLSEAKFTTAVKPKASSTSTETKGHSPTGETPSQQRGSIHSIDEVMDRDLPVELADDNVEITHEMERVLNTTDIINIYEDPFRVLQHLCGAFQLMSKAHSQHAANLSRCLLKFHKGIHTVTFHPVSYHDVHSKVNFDKFPSSRVKTLVALEDLGRGSTGKAWLCVTVTQPRSASCVLKFDNKHHQSEKLIKERDLWHLLYPEFACMVKVEHWSGADALMMPHFSTILESERGRYRDELSEVLNTHFMEKGKVHRDVRWRNIGKYHKDGKVRLVVYDLHDVVDYNVDEDRDWIEKAVHSLYVDV